MSSYNSESDDNNDIKSIQEEKEIKKASKKTIRPPLKEETKEARRKNIEKARETRKLNAINNKTLKDVENNLKTLLIDRKKDIQLKDLNDDLKNQNSENEDISDEEEKPIKKKDHIKDHKIKEKIIIKEPSEELKIMQENINKMYNKIEKLYTLKKASKLNKQQQPIIINNEKKEDKKEEKNYMTKNEIFLQNLRNKLLNN